MLCVNFVVFYTDSMRQSIGVLISDSTGKNTCPAIREYIYIWQYNNTLVCVLNMLLVARILPLTRTGRICEDEHNDTEAVKF